MNQYLPAIVAMLPVAILIALIVKRHPWPSHKALPLAAGLMWLLVLVYFRAEPNATNAAVVKGVLDSLTPVMIIWGAILLFKVMEASGGMDVVRAWLDKVTPNPVGQLMLLSFSFSFLIEGASGFGTPPALAAPLLVGLGFDPLRAGVCCLIMNSFPVSFGAVGVPTWFGFGELGLSDAALRAVGWKTALMHGVAALVIPLLALRAAVDWATIRRNVVYVYLCVLASIVPYFLVSLWSYEFPALLGGAVGFAAAAWLAWRGVGLEPAAPAPLDAALETEDWIAAGGALQVPLEESDSAATFVSRRPPRPSGEGAPSAVAAPGAGALTAKTLAVRRAARPPVATTPAAVAKALFPLWGSLLLLTVSRLDFLGLKGLLQSRAPLFSCALGTLGDWEMSWALVCRLSRAFGSAVGWTCEFLYVPAIIPFFVVMVLTVVIYRMGARSGARVFADSLRAVRLPAVTLAAALVLVTMLLTGGDHSPAAVIGGALASLTGRGWLLVAPYLGALGAFFSGSNTVSNLTFGGIQLAAARSLGLDATTVLALQSVGGALGHLVCINSIVAVGSILGLAKTPGYEGAILRRTFWPSVLYGLLAALVALALGLAGR